MRSETPRKLAGSDEAALPPDRGYRALSLVVLVVVLFAIAVSIAGDVESLSRTVDLYLQSPASHALDVFSDEDSFNTDPARDSQRIVLREDTDKLHIPDTGVNLSQTAYGTCLTRSPPSA